MEDMKTITAAWQEEIKDSPCAEDLRKDLAIFLEETVVMLSYCEESLRRSVRERSPKVMLKEQMKIWFRNNDPKYSEFKRTVEAFRGSSRRQVKVDDINVDALFAKEPKEPNEPTEPAGPKKKKEPKAKEPKATAKEPKAKEPKANEKEPKRTIKRGCSDASKEPKEPKGPKKPRIAPHPQDAD